MFTRSQDSPTTEFSNALVPGKKASKAGRSDCLFDFFYTEILATLIKYFQMFLLMVLVFISSQDKKYISHVTIFE